MKIKKMLLPFLFFLCVYSTSFAYDRGQVYINGIVNDISGDTITISGKSYGIDPACEYVMQYRADNALHQKKAARSDIRRGDSVYAKKIGSDLYEIIIEGWKK